MAPLTEGGRLKLVLGLVVVLAAAPVLFMVLGGPEWLEEWAMAHPESGLAEWTARKLDFYYLLTLRPGRRVRLLERYLDTFNEDAAAHRPELYREIFWEYARVAADYYPRGRAGRGYYEFAVTFPEDERAEEAEELARSYGYRPPE